MATMLVAGGLTKVAQSTPCTTTPSRPVTPPRPGDALKFAQEVRLVVPHFVEFNLPSSPLPSSSIPIHR